MESVKRTICWLRFELTLMFVMSSFRNNSVNWLEIKTVKCQFYTKLLFSCAVKYAGQGTIAVDNLLIYTRLSTANGQPGHLGCSE